ncbi:MAG TPA: enolase C-terminal domain-like protein [Planctomycetota bacterium]|nr:enolase C-terminal domain-like protein [Planctomycetota bacterium]
MRISELRALEVLDSRGMPTLKVSMEVDDALGEFYVPAGASTGKAEATELRDGGARYGGKGVRKAAVRVLSMAARLHRARFETQAEFDAVLDEEDLAGNVSLGLSGAFARATAAAKGIPIYRAFGKGRTLPRPMVNLISGGLHGGNNIPIQDILIVPLKAKSFADSLELVWRVYHAARSIVGKQHGYNPHWVADEGGFAPRFKNVEEALDFTVESIERAGLKPGVAMSICLDVAASHAEGISLDILEKWAAGWPIISIEDGVPEDDWEGWRTLTRRLGRLQLIGDDFFATNPQRLRRGIRESCANAVLVKMNQIGTITQTLEVIEIAKAAGYQTVVSARSGETEDSTMSDLAVGADAGQIKIGSIARSERLAKYNRLLEIEAELKG